MNERLLTFLIYFPAFLVALSFHESAHGWVANRFGDDTAKRLGRISLNPIRHMDFIGTFLLPLVLFFSQVSVPIGGWGKPVPVDYRNLQNPRKDGLWIALAGPASNIFLALACGLVFRIFLFTVSKADPLGLADQLVIAVLSISIWINLGLAVFNLIPLHPLDGGKILLGLLPEGSVTAYNQIARYGFLIIFIVYYTVGFGFIYKPVQFLANWLIPL